VFQLSSNVPMDFSLQPYGFPLLLCQHRSSFMHQHTYPIPPTYPHHQRTATHRQTMSPFEHRCKHGYRQSILCLDTGIITPRAGLSSPSNHNSKKTTSISLTVTVNWNAKHQSLRHLFRSSFDKLFHIVADPTGTATKSASLAPVQRCQTVFYRCGLGGDV
jgi:hypothetical protein